METIPRPLRIRITENGETLLVYLRCWSSYTGCRSTPDGLLAVGANDERGYVRHLTAALNVEIAGLGSRDAHRAAIDAHLIAHGAEIVPPGEWPVAVQLPPLALEEA